MGSMRKTKERPVSAAVIKMMSKRYFTFRRLSSAFKLKRFFFRKKRKSKKSMETPIGQI
jgi:hypothetical protein